MLWVSVLDLLGRQTYGPVEITQSQPDAKTSAIVAGMAELITSLAQQESPRRPTDHLVYAAELQAMLHHRAAAIATLGQLPVEDRYGLVLSDALVQLIRVDAALPLGLEMPSCQPWSRIRLALVAQNAVSATQDLKQALAKAAARKPWPDFAELGKIVAFAAKGRDMVEALDLARRLADTAKTKRATFPVFPYIEAARALPVADAAAAKIRQSLDLARAGFPHNPNVVVGTGVVSGPIQSGGFGLDAKSPLIPPSRLLHRRPIQIEPGQILAQPVGVVLAGFFGA